LHKFKAEGLIHGDEKLDEKKDMDKRKRTYRGSRRHMHFCWFFKYEHFSKVVSYRHSMILSTLTKKVDKAAQYYSCPNPTCPLKGNEIPILELLARSEKEFRCQYCKIPDEKGELKGIILKLTTASADELGGVREKMMKKFNEQIGPIQEKLREVNELLRKFLLAQQQQQLQQEQQQAAALVKNELSQEHMPQTEPKIKKLGAPLLPWERNSNQSMPSLESESKIVEAEKLKKEAEEKKT